MIFLYWLAWQLCNYITLLRAQKQLIEKKMEKGTPVPSWCIINVVWHITLMSVVLFFHTFDFLEEDNMVTQNVTYAYQSSMTTRNHLSSNIVVHSKHNGYSHNWILILSIGLHTWPNGSELCFSCLRNCWKPCNLH